MYKKITLSALLIILVPLASHAAESEKTRQQYLNYASCIMGSVAATLVFDRVIIPLFQQNSNKEALAKLRELIGRYAQQLTMPETYEELQRLQGELADALATAQQLIPSLNKTDKKQAQELVTKMEADKKSVNHEAVHRHAREQLKSIKERRTQSLVIPADNHALVTLKNEITQDHAMLDELREILKTDNPTTATLADELSKKVAHDKSVITQEESQRYQAEVRQTLHAKYKEELNLLGKNALDEEDLNRIVVERFGQDRDTMLQNYFGTLAAHIQHACNAGVPEEELEPLVNLNKLATRLLSVALAQEKDTCTAKQHTMKIEQLEAQRAQLLFDEEIKQKRASTAGMQELTAALAECRKRTEAERALVAENGKQLERAVYSLKDATGNLVTIGSEQRHELTATRDSIAHFTGQAQDLFAQLFKKIHDGQTNEQQGIAQVQMALAQLLSMTDSIQKQSEATHRSAEAIKEEIQGIRSTNQLVAEQVGIVPPATNPFYNPAEPSAPAE